MREKNEGGKSINIENVLEAQRERGLLYDIGAL